MTPDERARKNEGQLYPQSEDVDPYKFTSIVRAFLFFILVVAFVLILTSALSWFSS